jgi:hypothetical protein
VSKRVVLSLLGAMAIAAVAMLGGCGGDDDDSTSGGSEQTSAAVSVETNSLTKAQYGTKAQKVCAEEIAKISGVVKKAIVKGTPIETESILPAFEQMLDRLTALGAPKGQEAEVEAFLTALQEDLDQAKTRESAKATELGEDFKKSGDLARGLGLESCALG